MTRITGPYLLDEIHGLSRDGQVVITVQHWTPGTLLTFRNGRRVAGENSTRAATARRLEQARAALAATALTPEQAWVKLRELVGATPLPCPGSTCGEQLPVGAHRCVRCGLSMARHAAGALSGANRRGVIDLSGRTTRPA